MMSLYDEEEVMRSYIKSEIYDATQERARESAKRMIKKGKMTIEEIADYIPELSLDDIKKLEIEVMQLV